MRHKIGFIGQTQDRFFIFLIENAFGDGPNIEEGAFSNATGI